MLVHPLNLFCKTRHSRSCDRIKMVTQKKIIVITLESLYPKLGLMRLVVLLLLLTRVLMKLLKIVRVSEALLTTRRRRA